MKVTLRNSYSYNDVFLTPESSSWEPEMQVDLPIKEVLEILEVQTKMTALQQQLKPMYEVCVEARTARYEAEKAEKERLEAENVANSEVAIG